MNSAMLLSITRGNRTLATSGLRACRCQVRAESESEKGAFADEFPEINFKANFSVVPLVSDEKAHLYAVHLRSQHDQNTLP
jgi:hypothetical protein